MSEQQKTKAQTLGKSILKKGRSKWKDQEAAEAKKKEKVRNWIVNPTAQLKAPDLSASAIAEAAVAGVGLDQKKKSRRTTEESKQEVEDGVSESDSKQAAIAPNTDNQGTGPDEAAITPKKAAAAKCGDADSDSQKEAPKTPESTESTVVVEKLTTPARSAELGDSVTPSSDKRTKTRARKCFLELSPPPKPKRRKSEPAAKTKKQAPKRKPAPKTKKPAPKKRSPKAALPASGIVTLDGAEEGINQPHNQVYLGPVTEAVDGIDWTGWIQQKVKRMGGASKGHIDCYWYPKMKDTKKRLRLRSMNEVKRFLAALKASNGDEDKAMGEFKKAK